MNHIDVIYCINLRRRTDRLKSFLEKFPKSWITKLRIFGAIDGHNHELSSAEKHVLRNADWDIEMKKGVWGCSFSHEQVYRDIIAKNYKHIIILEDDAIFTGDFLHFEKIVNQLVKHDLGLCFLGPDNHPENTNLNKHTFVKNQTNDEICTIDFNLGTMSYYIDLSTVINICKIIDSKGHYRAIDFLLYDYLKTRYCCCPPTFSINYGLGSDIFYCIN
jgi:GR25 family glycosyltransferase involved in LPS biosynthesis